MKVKEFFFSPATTGQYTISLECLQPGYRHVPLQSLTGEELPHAKLFVHVALTNRRGGGKPHKRGLSVRKARKGRDYTALRDLGIRGVDEVFKMAAPLLREATDLRENMQVPCLIIYMILIINIILFSYSQQMQFIRACKILFSVITTQFYVQQSEDSYFTLKTVFSNNMEENDMH